MLVTRMNYSKLKNYYKKKRKDIFQENINTSLPSKSYIYSVISQNPFLESAQVISVNIFNSFPCLLQIERNYK